jgi:hypothetical protein
MKPVAILGVGPAGLMAAYGMALQGQPVSLFGQPRSDGSAIKRSVLGGAQFLHSPLPGIHEEPDAEITYRLMGTPEGYRKKVYRDTKVPFVSMEFLHDNQKQPAWSLQKAYDVLWDELCIDRVGNVQSIDAEWLRNALDKEWFSAVISTVPAPAICLPDSGHLFHATEIRIGNEAMMERPNTIFYSGDPDQSWYRSATLFGHESTEWNANVNPSLPETFKVKKPLRTNCDCFLKEVAKMGRYGAWTKGVLTHHAFEGAYSLARLLSA